MPSDKQISNPGGAYGLTADPSSQIIVDAVNGSGGTLVEGDVVIITDTNGVSVTTTTTASDTAVVGVVGPGAISGGGPGAIGSSLAAASSTTTYAASAVIPVIVYGPARVNIAANTVAAKAMIAPSAVAKVAAVPGVAGSVAALQAIVGSFFAQALESQAAKDANNTIRCFLKSA